MGPEPDAPPPCPALPPAADPGSLPCAPPDCPPERPGCPAGPPCDWLDGSPPREPDDWPDDAPPLEGDEVLGACPASEPDSDGGVGQRSGAGSPGDWPLVDAEPDAEPVSPEEDAGRSDGIGWDCPAEPVEPDGFDEPDELVGEDGAPDDPPGEELLGGVGSGGTGSGMVTLVVRQPATASAASTTIPVPATHRLLIARFPDSDALETRPAPPPQLL